MLTGWRIVPANRAVDAFVGEGARRFGGRWNSPGLAVVYGSAHKSLAALEQLVHRPPHLPNLFKAFRFEFPETLLEVVPPRSWPRDWRLSPPTPAAQQVGDAWVRANGSAVLAVPSSIIPEELNFILNPAHPDFKKVAVDKPQDFAFDPRLLR